MINRSTGSSPSRRARGTLWMLAAFPMLLGPVLFDGDGSTIAIGLLFMILGVTTLRSLPRPATRAPDSGHFSTEI